MADNFNKENGNGIKTVSALQKKISRLRVFVYLFLAISVLMTCVSLLWIYSAFIAESPFETYYSTAPTPAKALLYLSPKEGNYKVGDEFSVDILLNTAGSDVVVSAAHLSYNKSKMEALSINLSGSIFEMTAEKEINAKDGKIKITLGKPTPGVKAQNGKVATVNFRAKDKTRPYTDNVYFDFTKGSALYSTVILDDKQGTNILDATRGAKINIE